ncbi:MAG TPA: hypothetical protein VFS97_07880 [Nitrososphaeraceae archaeon]|nr:hypothetical protein [Nitrososphaeraceae archaeon]
MQINKISIIIIMVSVLIITSGTSILSSLVLAQTDLSNITLMNSSENQIQVGSSGAELPQQEGPIPPTPERQPQGPIPPAPEEQPSEEPTIR